MRDAIFISLIGLIAVLAIKLVQARHDLRECRSGKPVIIQEVDPLPEIDQTDVLPGAQ